MQIEMNPSVNIKKEIMKTIFYNGIALAVVFFSLAFATSAQEGKVNPKLTPYKVKVQHFQGKNKAEAQKRSTNNRKNIVRTSTIQPLPIEKREALKQ